MSAMQQYRINTTPFSVEYSTNDDGTVSCSLLYQKTFKSKRPRLDPPEKPTYIPSATYDVSIEVFEAIERVSGTSALYPSERFKQCDHDIRIIIFETIHKVDEKVEDVEKRITEVLTKCLEGAIGQYDSPHPHLLISV
ncbi:MAG: hypothetical protein HN411_01530 [Waddliaceae bacterium]|jgi:hypothetical protein|nr:hypothetical protein [Waddliaceae bacterium]MBT3578471.1 hypothetical protein [Waddliaceae bacterium]MBT4444949.1 hypothetical protein [Waddliaceae bacterium]MBT6927993.1 hypothetical protein [Waddliaceae bacterium]MBT7263891.1 hypothetical protein [Waddliaceae bacterium]